MKCRGRMKMMSVQKALTNPQDLSYMVQVCLVRIGSNYAERLPSRSRTGHPYMKYRRDN